MYIFIVTVKEPYEIYEIMFDSITYSRDPSSEMITPDYIPSPIQMENDGQLQWTIFFNISLPSGSGILVEVIIN